MGASNHDNHQDPLSDNPETKVVHAQYAKDSPGNETRFPPRIIVEQQGRILRRTFFVILLIALGISILFNFGLLAQYQSYIQSDPEIIDGDTIPGDTQLGERFQHIFVIGQARALGHFEDELRGFQPLFLPQALDLLQSPRLLEKFRLDIDRQVEIVG